MNDVKLIGNLGKDPELKYLSNGTALTTLNLGVSRSYKQGDDWKKETCWVEVTVWDKQAEKIASLSKGDKVLVEGRLKQDSWEKDGKKFSKLTVTAFKVYPFGAMERPATEEERPTKVEPIAEIEDEDLPF